MEHRGKHKLMRTVYLIIVLILFVFLMKYLLNYYEPYVGLLIGFIIGLCLLIIYESFVLKHMKKHKQMYVNTATQIYIGSVAIAGSIITLLLYFFFSIPIETGLSSLLLITLLFLVLTIKQFDQFLEKRGY